VITAPAILYADYMGLRYFTGKASTLPLRPLQLVHRAVFIGITLLVVTGIIITVPRWFMLFDNILFYAKLAFVLTLIVNGLFIHKLMHKATSSPFASLELSEKRLLMFSGALSGISWIVTIIIGFGGL
jgi:hypothetical protein